MRHHSLAFFSEGHAPSSAFGSIQYDDGTLQGCGWRTQKGHEGLNLGERLDPLSENGGDDLIHDFEIADMCDVSVGLCLSVGRVGRRWGVLSAVDVICSLVVVVRIRHSAGMRLPQHGFSVSRQDRKFWHLLFGPVIGGHVYRVHPIGTGDWAHKKVFFVEKTGRVRPTAE